MTKEARWQAVHLLAMHRAGCVNPRLTTARECWREVYRDFRQQARDLHYVRKQLVEFRGF